MMPTDDVETLMYQIQEEAVLEQNTAGMHPALNPPNILTTY